MAARSNRATASAAAAALEWAALLSTAARNDNVHHVKAVCLDVAPGSSNTVKLMCFTPCNQPLDIGFFLCEDGQQNVIPGFSPVSTTHAVLEVVFQESTDADNQHEGIILGIKDGNQNIYASDLHRLRCHMDE